MEKFDLSAINLNLSEDDKKRPLIFYAAGKFAETHIKELHENEIVPMCFADKNQAKHNTVFCGYEILSLDCALERYPDALIVLTCGQKNLAPIVNELTQIVDAKLLRYPYETYYGLGCDFLGTHIVLYYHGKIGCSQGKRFTIPGINFLNDSLDISLSAIPNHAKTIIQKIIAGEENDCTGCKELKENFWETKPRVNALYYSSAFKGAVCNYNCPECSHNLWFKSDEKYKDINRPVASELLQYFYDNYKKLNISVDKSGFYCLISIGETAMLPDFENILKIIDNAGGWIIPVFATNGSIYSELWVKSMQKHPEGFLLCDISAGTVDTYKKLKGVTCIERVVDNLEKYVKAALTPSQICIKYIFFDGINDNMDDVNGFLEIAKRLKCNVYISNNLYKMQKITDKIKESYIYMTDELNRNNIIWQNDICQKTAFEGILNSEVFS